MKNALLILSFLFAYSEANSFLLVNRSTIQPEGIALNPNNGFFLSSLLTGAIYSVSPIGVSTPFSNGPLTSKLISTTGLLVVNNVLYATNINFTSVLRVLGNDFGGPFYSGLVALDLASGNVSRSIDLSTNVSIPTFANDIAVDGDQNIYVTDSFGARIFKITPQGVPSVFSTDVRFVTQGIGLNGIKYSPNGYLLTVHTSSGKLFKVTVPGAIVTEVIISGGNLTNGDGLYFDSQGDIVVVKNFNYQIALVRSTDNWNTANIIEIQSLAQPLVPTDVVANGNDFYVVHTAFAAPFPASYSIEKVNFVTLSGTSSATPAQTTSPHPNSGKTLLPSAFFLGILLLLL